MKGLFLKDLYMVRAYSRSWLFIAVFFLAFSFLVDDSLFFLLYPMVLVAMLPVSLLSYDERFKWHVYCDALPLSRAQVVTEKYLFSLLSVAVLLLLLGGIRGSVLLIQGKAELFWTLLGALLLFGLVCPSLILPFLFHLGVEKGRIAYYCLIGAFCALCIVFANHIQEGGFDFSAHPLHVLLILLFGAAVYLLSWRLSICFYERREL